MTRYQVTFWRDLPSMVAARDGDVAARAMLADRFQGAIDEAAMRLGDIGSDDYLNGWTKGEWTDAASPTADDSPSADDSPTAVVARVVAELDDRWPQQKLTEYLDALGPKDPS
ncbi:MAG: virulence factor [Jatrophihabitans sp.]